MNDIPDGYYRDGNGMLKQKGVTAQPEQLLLPSPPIDAETMDALDLMTHQQLIALIKRVSGAMWGIGIQTQQEREDAMLLKLSILALTSDMAKEVVPAIREYFDRTRGKPAQTIVQTNVTLTLEQLVEASYKPAQIDVTPTRIMPGADH